MAELILGTAGHIDHGKTSLVRALTGVDTDRLPEEKKRGITIDIGFAELEVGDHRLGVVDVPGHERFVRNMLAGATGVDLALLVVAADDSIKPQTREHLEILRLLDLQHGVIAITKADLVEPDWLELVQEEVRELVAETFLADAPIVATSAETKAGLDELREQLRLAADQAAKSPRMRRAELPFRLPIDRVFTIAGHGAVVTGSVVSGQAAVGDSLVLQPSGVEVRVRGLQNHDRTVEHVERGQRAAINLAGVRHDDVERGQELSAPGYLRPSQLLTVRLSLLDSGKPLKDRSRIRLHLGSAELLATVRLLRREPLAPGEEAIVQLTLGEPVTSIWSQPFVLRSESPVVTIGGGIILSTDAARLRRPDELDRRMLQQLGDPDPDARAAAAAFFFGVEPWTPVDLARATGVDDIQGVIERLRQQQQLETIEYSVTRRQLVQRDVLDRLADRVVRTLGRMHDEQPLRSSFPQTQLAHAFEYLGDTALLDQLLKRMQRDGLVHVGPRGVTLKGRGPKLSKNERQLLEQLITTFRDAGLHSPTVAECQQQAAKLKQAVPQLVALAVADGELIEIASDYVVHREAEREAVEKIRAAMSADGLTLSQIREVLSTTRKYAVPFCEYLDREGVTTRRGDVRVMA